MFACPNRNITSARLSATPSALTFELRAENLKAAVFETFSYPLKMRAFRARIGSGKRSSRNGFLLEDIINCLCLIDFLQNEFLLAFNKGTQSAFAGLHVPKFSFKDSRKDRVADELGHELQQFNSV